MDLAIATGLSFDLALTPAGHDLATDAGLRAAVVISLFSDRRADADDEIPDGTTDRRGCWQESFPAAEGDQLGSRLWLLARAKEVPETLSRAEQYAREALAWLVTDSVAADVGVEAFWARSGVLGLRVAITLRDRARWEDVFSYPTEVV